MNVCWERSHNIVQMFLQNLYCESLIVKKGKYEDVVNLIKGLTMHERGSWVDYGTRTGG